MDKVLKTKWIKALESGDYMQGKSWLRVVSEVGGPITYCCLGVLCEVAGLGDTITNGQQYLDSEQLLKVGLKESQQIKFATFNDNKRMDFMQIASVIDAFI